MEVYLKHSLGKGTWVTVKDLSEASLKVRKFIHDNDCGNSMDPAWEGGDVREDGKVIARVSYNGRVWEPNLEFKEIKLPESMKDNVWKVKPPY